MSSAVSCNLKRREEASTDKDLRLRYGKQFVLRLSGRGVGLLQLLLSPLIG